MRLLFIRHGDPDYKNDCLNEIGLKEARALAALRPRLDLGTCYVSPPRRLPPLHSAAKFPVHTAQRLPRAAKIC